MKKDRQLLLGGQKITGIIFGLLLTILLLTGPSGMAQLLNVYEAEPPIGLDPYTSNGLVSRRLISLYCRPLFQTSFHRESSANEIEGVLAEPQPSRNATSLRVAIRPGAFHYVYRQNIYTDELQRDSIKVTARDVIATYHNLTNEKSRLGSNWYGERLRKVVQSMHELSEDEIQVVYRPGEMRSLPERVLDFPIVPAEAVPLGPIKLPPKKGTPLYDYSSKPWGSGPYIFKEVSERGGTTTWKLERAQLRDYARTFNYIDIMTLPRIHMQQILKSSNPKDNICVPLVPIGMRSIINPDFRIQDLNYPNVEQFMFNTENEILSDRRVRAALSLYIDRETLRKHLNGEADIVNGPMPFNYTFYCDTCEIPYYEYNPQRADSLLAAAGWIKDSIRNEWKVDGHTVELSVMGYIGSKGSHVSELTDNIVDGWKEFGIKAQSIKLPMKEYRKRIKKGNFDVAYHKLSYKIIPELDRHFVTGGIENYSNFSDTEVDSLWRALRVSTPAEARKIWHSLHMRIGMLVPGAFLWGPRNYALYSRWIDVGQNFYPTNFLGRVEHWLYE